MYVNPENNPLNIKFETSISPYDSYNDVVSNGNTQEPVKAADINIAGNTDILNSGIVSNAKSLNSQINGMPLYNYLSRDLEIRKAQINFLNSNSNDQLKWVSDNTETNKSIAGADVNKFDVAKSIHDLSKIDSLTSVVAKTTVAANGYFDKTTDMLGTTIFNQLDKLTNAAEAGLDAMASSIEGYKNNIVDAKTKYIDRNISPATGWATKKLESMSGSFKDDLHSFNQKVARNRLINTPGDVFNSVRHIAFALKGDLEKLIDFTHQIFAGITATIIKLVRLIRKFIKVITKILVSLIQSLIPTNFLEGIAASIKNILGGLSETIGTFFNTVGLETTTGLFDGLQEEVSSFAKDPLTYAFGNLDIQTVINIPGINNIKSLEKELLAPLQAVMKFADSLTLENLIKTLPKDVQQMIATMNQIANNAHGFVGNGVRSYVRKKILGGKQSFFLGKMKGIGIKFTLSEPYHYTTYYSRTPTPYLVFQKLLTDTSGNKQSVAVDRRGNKINYLSYTQTHLF